MAAAGGAPSGPWAGPWSASRARAVPIRASRSPTRGGADGRARAGGGGGGGGGVADELSEGGPGGRGGEPSLTAQAGNAARQYVNVPAGWRPAQVSP